MKTQVDQRMINFWARLVTGKSSKISSILYKIITEKHNSNTHKSQWLSHIQNTLDNLGMGFLMHSPVDSLNPNWIKSQIKLRITDIAKENWHDSINHSGQCRFYKSFKDSLIFEKLIHICLT